MKKSYRLAMGIFLSILYGIMSWPICANASEGEEYITISVDAEDENGTVLYALDSDEPSAFGPSNEFTVLAGTDHTVYVKDAAGNVSSQDFQYSDTAKTEESDKNINIDVVLDNTSDYSDYEYAGDVVREPAEAGQGTVFEKINTGINDTEAERLFYTVTTDDGEVFYLVIDQGQNSNNVYLLNQVKVSDLKELAIDDESNNSGRSGSLLDSLNSLEDKDDVSETGDLSNENTKSETKKNGDTKLKLFLILGMAIIGGGVYYYKNIYKKKKDEQMDLVDALDKDDFVPEDYEEDEDADFDLDDDYQEKTMEMLMRDDEIKGETGSGEESSGEVSEDVDEDITANYTTSHKENKFNFSDEDDDEYDEDLDAPEEDEE